MQRTDALAVFVCLATLFVHVPAQAQHSVDLQELVDRLDRAEQRIRELESRQAPTLRHTLSDSSATPNRVQQAAAVGSGAFVIRKQALRTRPALPLLVAALSVLAPG